MRAQPDRCMRHKKEFTTMLKYVIATVEVGLLKNWRMLGSSRAQRTSLRRQIQLLGALLRTSFF